jgi:outer membrane receptor protein involved in Fe transport
MRTPLYPSRGRPNARWHLQSTPADKQGFTLHASSRQYSALATGSQAILDRCVDNPDGVDNQFCGLVSRDPVGNIAELRRFPLNLNTFETSGMDIEVAYQADLGRFGMLSNRLVASFLDERTEFLSSDNDVDIIEGELGDPEWQLNYRGALLVQNWEVFLEARWIDDMFIEEQELLFGSGTNNDPNPDVSDNIVADSTLYVDLGASYNFDNGLSFGVTVDNVFDEDPPFALFSNDEDSGLYDNVGRFFLARASWSF